MPHSESPPGMKDAFHWTRVQNSKKLFLEIIAIGVKPTEIKEKTELNPTETEGRRIFKPWGELVEKCWRTLAGVWWWQRGKQLPLITKVRLLPSTGDWGTGGLSFLMTAFQRDGFQILKKDIPGQQHICTSKGNKDKIYSCKFSIKQKL